MEKPTIKSVYKGITGNKWKTYNVCVNGRVYHHQSKTEALRQYNSAINIFKKRNLKKQLYKLNKR